MTGDYQVGLCHLKYIYQNSEVELAKHIIENNLEIDEGILNKEILG